IFIDDVQDYVSTSMREREGGVFTPAPQATTLRSLLETVRQHIQRVVVVVTCRLEDEAEVRAQVGHLFTELVIVTLPRFKTDQHGPEAAQIITHFQSYGAPHLEDWDGTLGSLVLGLSRKNEQYLKLRNQPAAMVLRAMKLLTKANTLVHT